MKKIIFILIVALVAVTLLCLVGCNAKESLIDRIEIETNPRTVYVAGQEFIVDGGRLKVFYQDGRVELVPLTAGMVSPLQKNEVGSQTLQVVYNGATTTLVVRVVAPEVSAIGLILDNYKKEYKEEQNLDLNGVSLIVQYDGGAYEEIPVTLEMVSGFDNKKIGEQKLTVRLVRNNVAYLIDKTPDDEYFIVNVTQKQLQGIDIVTLPNTLTYYQNDTSLDLSGGSLYLRYDNGYPVLVNMDELPGLESKWDPSVISDRSTVTLKYLDKTVLYSIKVIKKDVVPESFKLLNEPTTKQLVNQPLNLDGLSFMITYTNGQSQIYFVPTDLVLYEGQERELGKVYSLYASGYDPTVADFQKITLSFFSGDALLDSSIEIEVSVFDKTITDIEIFRGTPENEQSVYTFTQIYPYINWNFIIHYDNGDVSNLIPLTMSMIENNNGMQYFVFDKEETITWHIVYRDSIYTYTGIYQFEVENLYVEYVSLAKKDGENFDSAENITVFVGHEADTSGYFLKIDYINGMTDYLALTNDMIDYNSFENDKLETEFAPVTITIAAYGIVHNAFIPVLMIKKVTGALNILTNPSLMDYLVFNSEDTTPNNIARYHFNTAGLTISLNYEFEGQPTTFTTFDDNWTFVCDEWENGQYGVFNSVGKKKIYVYYSGLDDPISQHAVIEVNVTNNWLGIRFVPRPGDNGLGFVYEGADIDVNGKFIVLEYENNANITLPLLQNMIKGYDKTNTTLGIRYNITIEYTQNNTTFFTEVFVAVIEKVAIGIEVSSLPNKIDYVLGDTMFIEDGLEINLVYSNNTRTRLNEADYHISNFNTSNVGKNTIIVSCRYQTTDFYTYFDINVLGKLPKSIAFTGGTPTINLTEGMPLDLKLVEISTGGYLKDLYVRVVYEGESAPEEMRLSDILDDLIVLNYSMLSPGQQNVEISYLVNSCILNINVVVEARIIVNISSNISVFYVIENSDLDLQSARLNLFFDNGTTSTVALLNSYIVYSSTNNEGYDKNDPTLGARQVTIRYVHNNKVVTTKVDVVVVEKQLLSIEMQITPKDVYIEGEQFDPSGGSIRLLYNNGAYDILSLDNAQIDNASYYFNINKIRFDNSEFTGVPKMQTIFIYYTLNGTRHATEYDITMRDRNYLAIEYDATNIYDYYYGDIKEGSAGQSYMPKFKVLGYDKITSQERNVYIDLGKFKVEYVLVEEYVNRNPSKDYTAIPKDVGVYYVIISYDAGLHSDMVHNSFSTTDKDSRQLTIAKKKISIKIGYYEGNDPSAQFIGEISKIYGTANPYYIITAKGVGANNLPSDAIKAFAYNEDFFSLSFTNPTTTYSSICYANIDGTLRSINYLQIREYLNSQLVTIGQSTGAGNYNLSLDGIVSKNYSIYYETTTFNIQRREVIIVPTSISVVYGSEQINIPYTAKDNGNPDISGLYGADILVGSLGMLNASTVVNTYTITTGTINTNNNPNYDIKLSNDDVYTVDITKRDIFVRADSKTISYMDDLPDSYNINYYRDIACTDTNAFAYSLDLTLKLGTINWSFDEDTSSVGKYLINLSINEEDKSLVANNYNIIFIKTAYLMVQRRSATLTINGATKVYGEADPEFTFTAITKINNNDVDITDMLDGDLTRANKSNDVNVYVINANDIINSNPNFNLTVITDFLTIVQKEILVDISSENLTKVYDGKLPKITNYTLKHRVDNNLVDYEGTYNTAALTISFLNFNESFRNFGEYIVTLSNSNSNYDVKFNTSGQYIYKITPLEIAFSDIIYDLPHNMEYTGIAFGVSAHVKSEKTMMFYNFDGSPKTDENNNYIFDTIEISLTLLPTIVLNAGLYSVSAFRLSNPNYQLTEDAKKPVEFSILPKKLYVKVKTNQPDGLTYQTIFSNLTAMLYENEHYYIEDASGKAYSSDQVGANVRVLNPNAASPTDNYPPPHAVRYYRNENNELPLDDSGKPIYTIIGYQIYVDASSSNNYVFELFKAYEYKIVPAEVTVILLEEDLVRIYDGSIPRISTFEVSGGESVTSLDQKTITFTLTRMSDATRSNSDAGEYNITLSCSDTNHIVTLAKDYIFKIEKLNVVTTIRSASLLRTYNKNTHYFISNDLMMSTVIDVSRAPRIKNYFDLTEFEKMKSTVSRIIAKALSTREAINRISLSDITLAKILIQSAINEVKSLQTEMTTDQNVLKYIAKNDDGTTNLNYTMILEAIKKVTGSTTSGLLPRLENLLEIITNSGNITQEEIRMLDMIISEMSNLYGYVERENNYIAFVITYANNPSATLTSFPVNAGNYKVEMYANDYNLNYIFNNINAGKECILVVNKKTITVDINNVDGGHYGSDVVTDIPYVVRDDNNIPISDDEIQEMNLQLTFVIVGSRSTGGHLLVGNRHEIILETQSFDNDNYEVKRGRNGIYTISKATIYLKISTEIGAGDDKIIYGNTFDPDRLKVWEADDTKPDQDGAAIGEDIKQYIYISDVTKFTCFDNNGNPVGSTTPVGIYDVNATEFTSNQYEIIGVATGKLHISKRALSISSNNFVISRVYGNEFDLPLSGYADNDLSNISNVHGKIAFSVNTLSSSSEASDLRKDADVSTYYHVYFNQISEEINQSIDNYYINVDTTQRYYFNITKAQLEVWIAPQNAPQTMTLTAEYGDTPSHVFSFSGFLTIDGVNDYNYLGISNLLANEALKVKSLIRDVANIEPLTLDDVEIKDSFYFAIKNYEMYFLETAYTVTPARLTVTITKEINVMYEPSRNMREYIHPYMIQQVLEQTGVDSSTGEPIYSLDYYKLIGGQYAGSDMKITGWKVGEDKYTLEQLTTIVNFFKEEEGETTLYLNATSILNHSLVLSGVSVGLNQQIEIAGMTFASSTPNYWFDKSYCTVNIYSKAAKLEADSESIVLTKDVTSANDIDKTKIRVYDEANNVITTTFADSKLTLINKSAIVNSVITDKKVNTNLTMEVNYNELFKLDKYSGVTEYNKVDVVLPVEYQDEGLSKVYTINNTLTKQINYRVFDTKTIENDHELHMNDEANEYQYGNVINGAGHANSYEILDKTSGLKKQSNYDVIETSIRLVPISKAYSYSLIINEYVDGGHLNSLKLVFNQGGAALVATVSNVNYVTNINAGVVDIFDGYTHDIKVYYNKISNTISVFIDDKSLSVQGGSGIVLNVPEEYKLNDDSYAGFYLNGVKAWLAEFKTYTRGYYDNSGIYLRSSGANVVYVSNISSKATFDLRSLFNINNVPDGYSLVYRFDGNIIDGTTTKFVNNVELGQHTAELALYYDDGDEIVLVDKTSINVLVISTATSVSIGSIIPTYSTPAELKGYTDDPAHPGGALTSSTPRSFEAVENAATSEKNRFTNVSMSFSLDRAKFYDGFDQEITRESTTYLQLMTTNLSYTNINKQGFNSDSNYRSVVLALRYTGQVNNPYETTLYVMVAGYNFYYDIPGLVWNSNSIYSITLQFDADMVNSESGGRVLFNIYENNLPLYALTISTSTVFTGVRPTGSNYSMNAAQISLLSSSSSKRSGIHLSDHKMTVYNYSIGYDKNFVRDYLYNNSAYTQKSGSGNTFGDVNTTNTVTLSNQFETQYFASYNASTFSFEILDFSTDNPTLTFFIALNEFSDERKSLALVYDLTTKELYFTFFNGMTQFAKQVVGTFDDFTSGKHTITAITSVEMKNSNVGIAGIIDNNLNYYYYRTVMLIIDGVTYTQSENGHDLMYPYYDRTQYWVNSYGTTSTNTNGMVALQFMGSLRATELALNKVCVKLYDYEVGFKTVNTNIKDSIPDQTPVTLLP